jgi:hypothetical protein
VKWVAGFLMPCNMGGGLNLSLQAICICFPSLTAQEVYFQLNGSDEVSGIYFEGDFWRYSSYGLRRHLSSSREWEGKT